MKAMILAAGRGERLRPLTDQTPKPLIPIQGKPIIIHQLIALGKAGIRDVVINISWLAEKIRDMLGDGKQYGLRIQYSYEPEALETGGGIFQALPLLGTEPFLVLNGDVWTDYPFEKLVNKKIEKYAHLVLVDNPAHNPKGDFDFEGKKLTLSGIAVYHPKFFAECSPGRFRLPSLLYAQLDKISFEHYQGVWRDIGTLESLQALGDDHG